MDRALELAARGRGSTTPNPMVGCVIVRDGEVLAEGYHHACGQDHAEVDALRKLDFSAPGATLYVNLEPCCHYGRTPPCTEKILASGVSRVVVATVDPNPKVHGKGIEALRAGGLDVTVGLRETHSRGLNEIYQVATLQRRPFVTLKTAVTLDGRTATRTGSSQWITGEQARAHGRRQRSLSQAIAVGVGTVLADDPQLTARLGGAPDPARVIFDSRLLTPHTARALNRDGRSVLICTTSPALASPATGPLRAAGAELIDCGPGPRVDLQLALAALYERELHDLYVEGGPTLQGAFVDAGLADRLLAYVAPKLFGGAEALPMLRGEGVELASEAHRFLPFRVTPLGDDVLLETRAVGGPAEGVWSG